MFLPERPSCMPRGRWAASGFVVLGVAIFAPAVDAEEERQKEAETQSADTDGTAERSESRNLLGLPCAPLEEPMVTDRPDFTESPSVVPWGHAQLEMGYTFTYDREDGVRTKDHTFPEALLRVGLVQDWELRIGWAGWSRAETVFHERNDAGRTVARSIEQTGGSDTYLGFKYHISGLPEFMPDLALIPAITVPTGAEDKTSGDVDPEIKLAWSYDLSERFSLSGNLNGAVPTDEDSRRFFQTAASISLGVSLTDWLGAYVEYYGFYPNTRGADCAHVANGGFTIPIGDNLQFDIRVGAGLNEEADDFFAGTGLAIRF